MNTIELPQDSSVSRQSVCLSIAVGLHALALLWNPTILRSHVQPVHEFVSIDVVEQPAPGGGSPEPEAPKKAGFMESLRDMLSRSTPEQIAHRAPEPPAPRVAAPVQPLLKERTMPRPLSTAFTPKSDMNDMAMNASPNAINIDAKNVAMPSAGGPTLKTKSFGGIKASQLPFQVGSADSISTGESVIPVAVGNRSSKSALEYGGASLSEAKSPRPIGIVAGRPGAGTGDLSTMGAGAAASIPLSGTGGTGNAPTGAYRGSSLTDRPGTGGGGGGMGGRGFGSGRGTGFGSGIDGMPSAAQELDRSLSAGSSGSGGRAKKGGQSFEIAGPLNNRPIVKKVIPQYPAWAEEQGIIGSVRLYFTVTPEGQVRANIRVTKTTGYPQLDQLGIDALKQWQFAPVPSSEEGKGEWGIITFNFSLSS